MTRMASQITSLTVVYSTVYSDADQRKHQSSASLAFVWGIHRGPLNSPHKGQVTRKMFPFDDVIMTSCQLFGAKAIIWINVELLPIGPLRKNNSEILIKMQKFSWKDAFQNVVRKIIAIWFECIQTIVGFVQSIWNMLICLWLPVHRSFRSGLLPTMPYVAWLWCSTCTTTLNYIKMRNH